MLTQETIYQNLQSGNFSDIIMLLYKHGNELDSDDSIGHAIDVFAGEFFSKVAGIDNRSSQSILHDLDLLFLVHKEGKYILKDQHIIKIVNLLDGRAPRRDLLPVAEKYLQDPFCKKIKDEHDAAVEAGKREYQLREAQRKPRVVMPEDNIIGKKYQVQIGQGDGATWIKVYLRSEELMKTIAAHLQKLAAVSRVNITKTKDFKYSLTVYSRPPFTIHETLEEVELTLENYFSKSPADPIFKDNIISGISEVAYYQIIDYMLRLGKSLEGSRKLAVKMGEEEYRDYFIRYLDSLSTSHSVTGETFHGSGKTDILVRNQSKEVLLVAECKLWTGKENLSKAITQLFERYLTWRDGKAALMIFNTKNIGFTNIIQTAVEALKSHALCLCFDRERAETSFSFTFRTKNDEHKTVKLELVLFNFV